MVALNFKQMYIHLRVSQMSRGTGLGCIRALEEGYEIRWDIIPDDCGNITILEFFEKYCEK